MEDKIIEGLAYTLPAVVTGLVAYMVLGQFTNQDKNDKKFEALVEKKRESLPLKLQAYERLLLFCERMNPNKLLLRVKPIGNEASEYANLLIASIEQEYEHNMVQQLYISDESWKAILTAKNIIKYKTVCFKQFLFRSSSNLHCNANNRSVKTISCVTRSAASLAPHVSLIRFVSNTRYKG